MTVSLNPAAPHHLPGFITAPGETDVFMVVMAVFLVIAVLAVGLLFLRLHTLPERHGAQGPQAAVRDRRRAGPAGPVHAQHIFWVAGLLLALIDIPDFGNAAAPDRGIAGEDRRHPAGRGRRTTSPTEPYADHAPPGEGTVDVPKIIPLSRMPKERTHA